MAPINDDDRFLEIEDAILRERERALAHIRSTLLGDRLRARSESPVNSGIEEVSRRRILFAFLGVALITAAASLIWLILEHAKTDIVPPYKALTTTLSLVIEPSLPEMSAKPDLDRVREEKNKSLIGRVLSQLIQGLDEGIPHKPVWETFDGVPIFTPGEINQILIRDRVIERALIIIFEGKQGGVT